MKPKRACIGVHKTIPVSARALKWLDFTAYKLWFCRHGVVWFANKHSGTVFICGQRSRGNVSCCVVYKERCAIRPNSITLSVRNKKNGWILCSCENAREENSVKRKQVSREVVSCINIIIIVLYLFAESTNASKVHDSRRDKAEIQHYQPS